MDVSTQHVFMVEETVLLDLSEQLPTVVVMGLHGNVDCLVKIIHEVVIQLQISAQKHV